VAVAATDTHRAIDAVWRIEAPRLIAGLARIVRDVGLAEDLAQDALVAALERWPESGVPDNPGAWLMATAKHRAIDRLRRTTLGRGMASNARSSRNSTRSKKRSPQWVWQSFP
jgi:predicted RNA polymerase sigma factor